MSLAAQTVRGTTADPTGKAQSGVVVQLMDSTNTVVDRGVSNGRGEFQLRGKAAGVHRVQALRIGFRPTLSAPVRLAAASDATVALVVPNEPISLDTVRVMAQSDCRAMSDSGAVAYAAWEQARAALAATQVAFGARVILATNVTYDRTLDPGSRRVRQEASTVTSGYVAQPWLTPSPDSVRRTGYIVTERDNSVQYYGPGLDMLLSPGFVEDHCFRIARSGDLVGLQFEPTAARRRIAEVRGTLWLDARSLELRRVEFRYVNANAAQEEYAGGETSFARMADGSWVISRWSLRMPAIEQRFRSESFGGPEQRVTAIRELGGELAFARRGQDTLWSQPPLTIGGAIVDSITGERLPSARIEIDGTSIQATADERGSFRLGGVRPGIYTLRVRTAALDSLNAVHQGALTVVRADNSLVVRVANPARIRAQLAALQAKSRAVLRGAVVMDSTKQPLQGAEVALPELGRSVQTNARGEFRLDDVPAGSHQLVVRRLGYGPLETRLDFGPGQTLEREVVLSRVTLLDSVMVKATSLDRIMADFEENRRVGLGKFMTREDLAFFDGRKMSAALAQMPGLAFVRGSGNQAWLTSSRGPRTLGTTGIYCPEKFEKAAGMTCGCYAQVYLDGTLMNPVRTHYIDGREFTASAPFDVNEIAPEQIEAIEYYTGAAETPLRYSALNSACGVLVIWRRRG